MIDENIPTLDEACSFAVVWTMSNTRKLTGEASFKEEKSVLCSADEPNIGRYELRSHGLVVLSERA